MIQSNQFDRWYVKYHQIYFEDEQISLAENQYLIFSTKVNLYNYQVQNTLTNVLINSNIKYTEQVPQDITFSQLNQTYIQQAKNELGTFQNRQKHSDLETWLRVNNLLTIFSNRGPVKIPKNALLTFTVGKKIQNEPKQSANDTFLSRLVAQRNK